MEQQGSRNTVLRLNERKTLVLIMSILAVAALLGTALAGGFMAFALQKPSAVPAIAASPYTANTYPTTTMQEPGYTNGTYVMAATSDIQHLNIYATSDLYSFYLLDEIYDSLYNLLPNQTIAPWLATGYKYTNLTAHPIVTTNPITGTSAVVNYTYNVTLLPGVQWTDWTPSNSGSTYTYDGITMNTYTVQSADVVLSWLILQSSADFAGTYLNVVNVVPVNNLTVSFYLSNVSATFTTTTLLNPILPYHIWVHHDWATNAGPGVWNATGAPNGYDVWNMNYNSNTGTASGLVGTGPFMFNGGYGMPVGKWEPGVYWNLYVNPHYFVQYVPALEQFTPKIFEVMVPLFGTESAAVTALTLGQVDTIEGGIDPTFISTVAAAQNTFIYYHPGSGYGFMQFRTYPSNGPFNITEFRQALNYAVDKTYIASVIDQGYTIPGDSIIPLSDQTWHNFSLPQYNYNPTLAASMLNSIKGLTKTGGVYYYNGNPVKADIEITTSSSNPLGVEAAQLIASEWTSLGIPTVVTQVSFIKLVADLIASNFNSISLAITGITGDPTSFLSAVYNNQQPGVFYQGPFSNITYNGVPMTGVQVQDLLNNLTTRLNTVTNLRERIAMADEIQGIAAAESTEVIFGYGVDIYPFYNGTFTGITETSLPQAAMIAFTFDTVHLKGQVAPTAPATIPTQLRVGVVADRPVYYDGQYGNLTIQVRNQFGQPVSGVSVAIGYTPTGGVLNVSSTSGTTNSAGQYSFEFQIFRLNQGVYTSDYAGVVNFSVAAYSNGQSNVVPGLGYTHVSTSPQPVEYSTSALSTLVNGSSPVPFTVTVTNPSGTPISGYSYAISALSGAVVMKSGLSGQTVSQGNTYNFLTGSGFLSVNSSGTEDWNVTTVNGVTGSNGQITVNLSVNSSVNFAAMGSVFESYIFLGDYSTGGAMTGAPPYVSIGELTSAANANGFGQQQPVEIPIEIAQTAADANVSITMTVANSSLGATAPGSTTAANTTTVTILVTNSTNAPIPNYTVTIMSQSALGANRGYLYSDISAGPQVQSFNPNEYFGSTFLPGFVVTTDASGTATATFSDGLFTSQTANDGTVFSGFVGAPFTDTRLIPFNEYEISAVGASGGIGSLTVVSQALAIPQTIPTFLSAFVGGASIYNGVNVLAGNASYTVYVNATVGSAAGPYDTAGVSVNVSSSLGTFGSARYATGSTGTSGTFTATLALPSVTVMTPITITVSMVSNGKVVSTTTTDYYAFPHLTAPTGPTTKNVYHNSTAPVPLYLYGALAAFIVLTVVFGALYATARGREVSKGGKGPGSGGSMPPQN